MSGSLPASPRLPADTINFSTAILIPFPPPPTVAGQYGRISAKLCSYARPSVTSQSATLNLHVSPAAAIYNYMNSLLCSCAD